MHILGTGLSDIGKQREKNEDALFLDNDRQLFIVCDGMGGHVAGELASRLACETAGSFLQEHQEGFEELQATPEGEAQILQTLDAAVNAACRAVFEKASSDRQFKGMGTTLTALTVVGDKAFMAHVGDSRLYLLREGTLHLMSHDHTVANGLVSAGIITPEEGRKHPYRNVLSRALGLQESILVDTLAFDVSEGDRFLLCSDGLSETMDPAQLAELLQSDDIKALPQMLVDYANAHDAHDNITVLLVQVGPAADEARWERYKAYKKRRLERARVLSDFFLARGLQLREFFMLSHWMQLVDYEAGDVLVHEGELCRNIYLVLRGSLMETRGGELRRTLSKGDSFGELVLFGPLQSFEQLTAQEPSRVLQMGVERFQKLLKRRPGLGVKLLTNLGLYLRNQMIGAEDTSQDTLEWDVHSPAIQSPRPTPEVEVKSVDEAKSEEPRAFAETLSMEDTPSIDAQTDTTPETSDAPDTAEDEPNKE